MNVSEELVLRKDKKIGYMVFEYNANKTYSIRPS